MVYRDISLVCYRKPIHDGTSRFVRVMKLTILFHTKICGVRFTSDIEAVGVSGADAIGLNFFPPSVRYVDPGKEDTSRLAETAKRFGLLRVGVFVNETVQTIYEIQQRVGLDVIQLHGDEPLGWTDEYRLTGSLPIVRAIKLPTAELNAKSIEERVRPWTDQGCHVLLDADAGAAHGGSGKTLDWEVIGQWSRDYGCRSWTLAGGLDRENVGLAKRISGAVSVDTASGTESSKGIKSSVLIQAFARAANAQTAG